MDELIEEFADHLRQERNFSPHTLRNYLSDLGQFHEFLRERELCLDGDQVDLRKVDVHVVRAYLAALAKDRKEKLHRQQARRAEKIFSLSGCRSARSTKIRCCRFIRPSRKSLCRLFCPWTTRFSFSGAVQLKTGLDVRDRAVLEVFYSTGIRVSELVGLNWADVDFQLGIVRVVGKGSKERIVPIGEIALQALQRLQRGAAQALASGVQRRDAGVS